MNTSWAAATDSSSTSEMVKPCRVYSSTSGLNRLPAGTLGVGTEQGRLDAIGLGEL
ncbi:Uncharacterised protein [Mycobacteroides abscessus subsp. abscessus]|nr:Uncharacterised protein [Mycobacteroides abscessus subsp. abscessus]